MAMKTIVALPGEGIGIEVVDATCELLTGTGLPLKILTPPQGAPLPEETKRAAREADGVLFGAAGPATSHVVSWLRWEMSAWAGIRPIRFYPGHALAAGGAGGHRLRPRSARTARVSTRAARASSPISSGSCPTSATAPGARSKEYGTEGRFAVKVVTPRGRRAHRPLRRRSRPEAEGAGQAGEGHLRHQVERDAPDRRALPGDRRARGARGGRARVRALPRGRRRAAPGALPEVHGRRRSA